MARLPTIRLGKGGGVSLGKAPLKPSLAKKEIEAKTPGKQKNREEERKKKKKGDGKAYENAGVVSMEKLLDELHAWFWGPQVKVTIDAKGKKTYGFDKGTTSKNADLRKGEGWKQAWTNLKNDFFNPATQIQFGQDTIWEDLMQRIKAIKLPQRAQGAYGRFVDNPVGRPRTGVKVSGKPVRMRQRKT